jgi:LysM domain
VADDSGSPPARRPRRRRSDTDPTYKPPKVANERRRASRSRIETTTAAPTAPSDPVAADPSLTPDPSLTSDRVPSDPAPTATLTTVASGGSWPSAFEGRATDPAICPFLRAADGDRLAEPLEVPDAINRCAALRDPVPQSLRQQELVCLTSGHVNCPRYLRGAVVVAEAASPRVRPGPTISPAILGSVAILVVAFLVSVGFTMSRGGLEMAAAPTPIPSSPAAGSVGTSEPAGASPTAAATSVATPPAVPTATVDPTPTAAPATPTPSPEPSATPKPTASPKPSSDRYALLTACPDANKCWIYVIRRGDNISSIANYFGVKLATVYDMNPWLGSKGLRAGQEVRLPPPTR